MIHLRTIEIRTQRFPNEFPFNLPLIQSWEPWEIKQPVTIFIGENGTGKSTLLEALACAIGSVTVGSQSVKTDPTLQSTRQLAKQMKLAWNQRTSRGFFLRAEDFFGYIKQVAQTRAELEREMRSVDENYHGRSKYAKDLARMPYARELNDLENRYGEGLEYHSHGEGYLELFQSRFVPGGLYLLDEPEAALSPLRQLGFLSLLKEMVSRDAQFIIATHSPILMAFPNATLLNFDQPPLQETTWEQLEHVTLTRDFLNNPQVFLRHI
jgi:predicted ATPase